MDIFNTLKTEIIKAGELLGHDINILKQASIEIPKDTLNGDLSTNIAMMIASKEKTNPRQIASLYKEELSKLPYVAHIEIAGPGFINFTIKASKWHESIRSILFDPAFGTLSIGAGEKINIEYVSANPTGPLHIGHTRCAVYGDVLARLLRECGYDITTEFYVNDAGSQIDHLVETVELRYKEALTKEPAIIPQGLYPGEYLIPVGEELAKKYSDSLLKMDAKEKASIIRKVAIDSMLDLIKADLKEIGVEHDIFFSETTLHERGKIDEVVKTLKDKALVFNGTLPPPKGKIDEEWEEREQLLFKSTAYGDDQDRPIQKADGSWSYFAADLAYAKDKVERKYDKLVYVLGADHGGYVSRIKAIVSALSKGKVECEVKICQLVNLVENGVPIKMSKRSGSFVTMKDVIDEVGPDVIRFIMLTRKNDACLEFDLEKVKEQSKENPVFYVQYAHVRTLSILKNAKMQSLEAYNQFRNKDFDLSLLSSEQEISLIKLLSAWPKILESAARSFEPHKITFYLMSIAAGFHSLWNLGKEDNDYRFIIEDNIELTKARLAMAESIRTIIAKALNIIGVIPLEKM